MANRVAGRWGVVVVVALLAGALIGSAAGCDRAGPAKPALAGKWSFSGTGFGGDKLDREYLILSSGEYYLDAQQFPAAEGQKAVYSKTHGHWEVLPSGELALLQDYSRANFAEPERVYEAVTVKFELAGPVLTLSGEDGNCPGSNCTRSYKRSVR